MNRVMKTIWTSTDESGVSEKVCIIVSYRMYRRCLLPHVQPVSVTRCTACICYQMYILYLLPDVQPVSVTRCTSCICYHMYRRYLLPDVQAVSVTRCTACICYQMYSLYLLPDVQVVSITTCTHGTGGITRCTGYISVNNNHYCTSSHTPCYALSHTSVYPHQPCQPDHADSSIKLQSL